MDRAATIRALAADWRSAGIESGDLVLIHSSVKRTLQRIASAGGEPSPGVVIESFLESVGSEGTLLFPLFNFDFTKGVTFDLRASPSHMGALSEAARNWPGAVRTEHPIYSFAAIGARADSFRGRRNFSGYGPDSVFGDLHHDGGKIAVLDLADQDSMTFYHYVEECNAAPYRYHKQFTAGYVDGEGAESIETFGLFVRNLEMGVLTHVNPMGEHLWDIGAYTGRRPLDGHGLRVIKAPVLFEEVSKVLRENRALGVLYALE